MYIYSFIVTGAGGYRNPYTKGAKGAAFLVLVWGRVEF